MIMNLKYRCKMKQKLFLFLLVSFTILGNSAWAQEIIVKGTVTDSDGITMPGVTVMVKGTNIGKITNVDGKYKLSAPSAKSILVFSFMGYATQEVAVDGDNKIDIVMEYNQTIFDDVVVIGYGTVKKKEVTGAVSQVKADQLSKVVTSDLGSALQGLVSGVNVSNSGSPGEAASILIRGVSSISGSNTPLYVVDGISQEGDPGLSTNEIESIDILKDAASCAIYGTRGSAGVILITTKQGKEGSLKISLNGSYGVQDITSSVPLMNATEQTYADMIYQRNVNDIKNEDMSLPTLKSSYAFQNDSDLGSLILNDFAPVQNYSVNISGGTKEFAYNLMAGYYSQEGIIINSGFDRFNSRINTVYNNGKWRVNGSVGLTQEKTDKAPSTIITNLIKYHPTMNMIDPNSDAPIEISHGSETGRISNVMESLKNTSELDKTKAFANFNLNYEIIDGLNLSTRIGINVTNDYQHKFDPYQEIYDEDGELQSDPAKDSEVTMSSGLRKSLTMDAGLTYKKQFADHKLTVFLGQSIEKYSYTSFMSSKTSVVNNDIKVIDGAVSDPYTSSLDNDYVNKLLGSIGRVQYDYKSRYLFSGSLRRDGSSKFAKGNRWGMFPSASVAWNISDEPFWDFATSVVDNFKLRASYGTVGNQNISPYSYSTSITPGYDYIFEDQIDYGFIMSSFSNPNIRWETSVQSNVGIDLSFFKNKVTFTAEYYNTNKKDMLMPIQLPGSTGNIPNVSMNNPKNSIVYFNIGDMTNSGFEAAIGYKASVGDLNFRVNGTFSTNKNTVVKVNGSGDYTLLDDSGLIAGKKSVSQVTAIAEGYEAGAFFLRPTDGVINTEEKLIKYQNLVSNAKMGDLIYVDTNGDSVISDEDRVYSGSGLPEFEMGASFALDYKGIDLSMQWYAALGHEIMNGAKATAYGWGRHSDLLYQWSEANPTSTIPSYRGAPDKHPNYEGHNDLWVEDGSFLRLKEATIGYSFNPKRLEKSSISKFRVYLSAQNPLTFTKYTGYDPEVGGNIKSKGLDKGNYPISSLYLVGLNLNF